MFQAKLPEPLPPSAPGSPGGCLLCSPLSVAVVFCLLVCFSFLRVFLFFLVVIVLHSKYHEGIPYQNLAYLIIYILFIEWCWEGRGEERKGEEKDCPRPRMAP